VATLPDLVNSLPVSTADSAARLLAPYPPIDVSAGLARLGETEVAQSAAQTGAPPVVVPDPVATPGSAPETETSQALDDVLSKGTTTSQDPAAKPKVCHVHVSHL
jgi:hypothetical protein